MDHRRARTVIAPGPACGFIARARLDALERGEEEVDPDPMAIDVRARLASDPKKLERFLARGLDVIPPA